MAGTKATHKPSKPTSSIFEKQALVERIKGKYAWVPYSSDDFNQDKRREIALEGRA